MPDHDHPGGEGLDVAFEEDVEPILVQAARDSLELEAWQLEQLAADLLPADLPPHLVEEAVGRLERLEGAATLLAAMAAAAPPPIAERAAPAVARLRTDGHEPGPAAAGVGRLTLVEAFDVDPDEPFASLNFICRRERQDGLQMFAFTATEEGGIEDGLVTPPMARDDLVAAVEDSLEGALRRQDVPLDEALERLRQAEQRSAAAGTGPTSSGVAVLGLVLRAAGVGDVRARLDALLALPLLPPVEHHHDEAHGRNDALVEAFAAWLSERGDASPAIETAAGVAHALGEFRLHEADGDLAGWTPGELERFLVEVAPHALALEDDQVPQVPIAVEAYVRFLEQEGLVDAEAGGRLVRVVRRTARRFEVEARRSRAAGPGRLLDAMRDEGVDLRDEAAVAAWLEEHGPDARAGAEQPAGDGPGDAGAPRRSAGRGRDAARRRRKDARAARRRNRG